ncbi:magnesium transporter CorA family protein [bacterium]|nr:magnesium transporter CorA family protein [bacterium]
MIYTIRTKTITWIDIKNPQPDDIQQLKEKFNLHPLVLKELLPPLDNPKIERFNDYIFLVLFYPFFNKKTFQTVPWELDIIVSNNYIITCHYQNIVPLKAIFDKCNLYEDAREKYISQGTGELLYQIIQALLSASFPKLSHIKENLDSIDKKIFQKKYKKCVTDISLAKRDILGFKRVLKPQKLVLENLVHEAENLFPHNLLPYFHNIINLYNQVDNILNTHKDTLDTLDATNQSLLDTWTNDIIRILTIFSVIVFPLNLFAAIFGMNTSYLPFVGKPYDFWVISAIMSGSAIVMLVVFKIKKWL